MIELSRRLFRPVDRQFVAFLARRVPACPDEVLLAAALASRAVGDGHICLDLASVAGKSLEGALAGLGCASGRAGKEGEEGKEKEMGEPGRLPRLEAWLEMLHAEAARAVLSHGTAPEGETRPLVLEGHRLYLQRYHAYERRLADDLLARCASDPEWNVATRALVGRRLVELFPDGPDEGQRFAAFLALRRRLLVITGGPGTGKTTTVARILALLIERHRLLHPDGSCRILLAAPTGKAAARVGDAIQAAKRAPLLDDEGAPSPCALRCDDEIRALVPEEASTLHRLLGSRPDSSLFRHHRLHPLDADVVVVDEASMVALPLMAKLVDALAPSTRLILLGDMDQLASVEPGHVLGDLCAAGRVDAFSAACIEEYETLTGKRAPNRADAPASMLSDSFVKLDRSHRFLPGGPIDRVARAVNASTDRDGADRAVAVLRAVAAESPDTVVLHPASDDGRLSPELDGVIRAGYAPLLAAREPAEALDALERFRILCALRSGPAGIDALNRHVTELLGLAHRGRHHAHRPVLVTRNDYELGLFNGDVGIILHEPDERGVPRARAWFRGADGVPRSFAPPLLPEHETCFAMTVHKSQGSEFDELLLLLPTRESPVLTKELVYTAITRARRKVGLALSEPALVEALSTELRAGGGLEERLRLG